jgi:hypothetical protein
MLKLSDFELRFFVSLLSRVIRDKTLTWLRHLLELNFTVYSVVQDLEKRISLPWILVIIWLLKQAKTLHKLCFYNFLFRIYGRTNFKLYLRNLRHTSDAQISSLVLLIRRSSCFTSFLDS